MESFCLNGTTVPTPNLDNDEGLKDFECHVCNKAFGYKSHLKQHITGVHEELYDHFHVLI